MICQKILGQKWHKFWRNFFSKPYLINYQYRVYRQRPIDNFVVDFYCPKLKLVIEIDGDSHYRENAQEYDSQRTEILQGYGLIGLWTKKVC